MENILTKWTKEEELWLILVHLFEADDHLYSPDYVARLLLKANFTDWQHIETVFFDEVFPVCIWPAYYSFGADFDEKKTVDKIWCYKKILPYKIAVNFITFFISRKEYKFELKKIKKEHMLHLQTSEKI